MTKYIKIVKEQLEYHNIELKREHIETKAKWGTWLLNDQHVYESIDQITSESMLHAEREVSRKFIKKYEWCPKLIQAVQGVWYWRLRLKKAKGLQVTDHILCTTRAAANLPTSTNNYLPLTHILTHLKASKQTLKHQQQNHVELREEYLDGLAEAILLHRDPHLASSNEISFRKRKAKQIQALKKREFQKRMFKKIGHALADNQDNLGGLVRVDIPASDSLEPYPIGPDPKTRTGPW